MRGAPRADVVFDDLVKQGWEYSHTATVSRYRYAGTISPMKSVGGYEYCRIHRGKCVSSCRYQLTYVMQRKIAA